jgi:hypothetical protein
MKPDEIYKRKIHLSLQLRFGRDHKSFLQHKTTKFTSTVFNDTGRAAQETYSVWVTKSINPLTPELSPPPRATLSDEIFYWDFAS